jgi:endonuclease III
VARATQALNACARVFVATFFLQVNEVTPELFTLAPDAAAMSSQDSSTVQRIIQPIGLAPTKAKNVVNMSKVLPCQMESFCVAVTAVCVPCCDPGLV